MSTPFSAGTRVLAAGAALLAGLLLIGFLLPTSFEIERSAVVPAPPERVYALLDAPEAWRRWTTWPDSGVTRVGPERGVGAGMSWDDRDVGSGTFTIVEAVPAQRVRYTVSVQGGAMRTEGTLTLTPVDAGVRVDWTETGDLGRNPLMGFWALSMERAQGAELEKGLARLAELASSDGR